MSILSSQPPLLWTRLAVLEDTDESPLSSLELEGLIEARLEEVFIILSTKLLGIYIYITQARSTFPKDKYSKCYPG